MLIYINFSFDFLSLDNVDLTWVSAFFRGEKSLTQTHWFEPSAH